MHFLLRGNGLLAAAVLLGVFLTTVSFSKAEAFQDGELVKTPNSGAIYLIQNGSRRVFPHLNVYLSWGYPKDFSSVRVVSENVLLNYPETAPVPFRDGYLFRGMRSGLGGRSASAVYLVSNGLRRPVLSAEIYQALYNDLNWSRVMWVPDDLLEKFDYPEGEPVASSVAHPDGTLVKYKNSPHVYVILNNQKRLLETEAIVSNRYDARTVVVISDIENYPDGPTIRSKENSVLFSVRE